MSNLWVGREYETFANWQNWSKKCDRAILYQDGKLVMDVDITKDRELVDVVRQFFEYRAPAIASC